ncbi:MFS-type transporter pyvG [Exophiala dermatitidis]
MFQFFFSMACAVMQMNTFLRDTPAGQLLRLVGFKEWLAYPEELPGFEPSSMPVVVSEETAESDTPGVLNLPAEHDIDPDLEKVHSKTSIALSLDQTAVKRRLSQDGLSEAIMVSFTENDSDNPRNWSPAKKNWTLVVINLYTFVVYCTASIITPTAGFIMKRFGVSIVVASLGLSMYVVGYGIGPMFFSPISEIPRIGRNPPYLYSFIVFFGMSIALAFVDNFPGLIVLRFLQGLFGSPCLASGAASIDDIYDMYSAPYGYIWWVASMYCGPAFGPLLAGYAVADNWRWPLYEVVIMAGIVLVLLPLLPETSPTTILLNRARRLRQATGNKAYLAPSELNPRPFSRVLKDALEKPGEITVKDPAIAYACVYGAIVYATYYSFFEAFPLVYLGTYTMSQGALGLIFTNITVGCLVGLVAYWIYLRYHFIPRAKQYHQHHGEPVPQEQWLRPGLLGVWGPPAGLFLFAWTARADVHWIAPTAGIAIFAATSFWVFQSLICYIPLTYPKYVASLFAANDLSRSTLAAAFVQVTHQMYVNLGIDRGITLVAGLSCIGVVGMYGLYYYGAFLRARSKFTG